MQFYGRRVGVLERGHDRLRAEGMSTPRRGFTQPGAQRPVRDQTNQRSTKGSRVSGRDE
jgi:hypothetical protein